MKIMYKQGDESVQINNFHVESPEDFHSFWQGLQDKYDGYKIDFCYRNCKIPIDFMNRIGAVVTDTCAETKLFRENFTPVHGFTPTLVTDKNFAAFAELHDKTNPDMYWTSEKISRDLSLWRIYTYGDAYVMMNLWNIVAEIYTLENANVDDGAVLLSTAVAFAFETGKESIVYMVDDNEIHQAESTQLVGFMECGRYILYRGVVKPIPFIEQQS